MKIGLIIFAFITFATLGRAAPDMVSTAIRDIEIGIVCAPDPIGSRPAPNTIAGVTHEIDQSPKFVSGSQIVPAEIGVGFGARVQARDVNGIDGVTVVVTHPPMGDAGTTEQRFQSRVSGVSRSFSFYQFDYAYELQPGIWTFAAEHNGKQLYHATFEVVAPGTAPGLADICGYREMLS